MCELASMGDFGADFEAGRLPEGAERFFGNVDADRGKPGCLPAYSEGNRETTEDRLRDPIVVAAIAATLRELNNPTET